MFLKSKKDQILEGILKARRFRFLDGLDSGSGSSFGVSYILSQSSLFDMLSYILSLLPSKESLSGSRLQDVSNIIFLPSVRSTA